MGSMGQITSAETARGMALMAPSASVPKPVPQHQMVAGGAPSKVFPHLRYSVEGFLDKNKDTLFQDFKRLLYNRLGTSRDREHSGGA